jgi:energy-coupling factor transporter ATP-binding protein EcfA2
MLDEPTAGVSPIVMDELFDRIIEVARTGISILMVEQNARQALEIADKGFVLVQGRNRFTDTGKALMADPQWGGLAIDTAIGACSMLSSEDGGFDGVELAFAVLHRTVDTDWTTQA